MTDIGHNNSSASINGNEEILIPIAMGQKSGYEPLRCRVADNPFIQVSPLGNFLESMNSKAPEISRNEQSTLDLLRMLFSLSLNFHDDIMHDFLMTLSSIVCLDFFEH